MKKPKKYNDLLRLAKRLRKVLMDVMYCEQVDPAKHYTSDDTLLEETKWIEKEGAPCKRCGEKPEILTHCTLYEVRCINKKCSKCSTVGSHNNLENALTAWKRKQCPHKNKGLHEDFGHLICKDCGQLL